MQGFKKALHVVINVILWLLIIVIAFFAIVTFSRRGTGNVMNLFGYTPMTVLSDSMAPTFYSDDLIIIRQGDQTSYEKDDIISFWTVIDGQRSINTHRIVDVYREGAMVQYTTKGDANPVTDSYVVAPADVIGKYVVAIPLLGKVMTLLSSSIGFLVIVVLPVLAFFLYQLYRLILLLIEIKRQTVIDATRDAMAQLEAERVARETAAVPPPAPAPPAEPVPEVPAEVAPEAPAEVVSETPAEPVPETPAGVTPEAPAEVTDVPPKAAP